MSNDTKIASTSSEVREQIAAALEAAADVAARRGYTPGPTRVARRARARARTLREAAQIARDHS